MKRNNIISVKLHGFAFDGSILKPTAGSNSKLRYLVMYFGFSLASFGI